MVPCLETGLALVWSVRMTSEDPIPLDQDPMQSWIGVAHSGGLCTLDVHLQCMFECKVNFILLDISSTQLITYFTCSHFS